MALSTMTMMIAREHHGHAIVAARGAKENLPVVGNFPSVRPCLVFSTAI
jgi:hypothetical protein